MRKSIKENYQAAKKSKEELKYNMKSNRTHFDMNC